MPKSSPVKWQAPDAPELVDEFAVNDRLSGARLIATPFSGPEDVVVDSDGAIYTGTADGSILRVTTGGAITPIAEAGGRPLGADLGLQRVTKNGNVDVLADRFGTSNLVFTNNASVADERHDLLHRDFAAMATQRVQQRHHWGHRDWPTAAPWHRRRADGSDDGPGVREWRCARHRTSVGLRSRDREVPNSTPLADGRQSRSDGDLRRQPSRIPGQPHLRRRSPVGRLRVAAQPTGRRDGCQDLDETCRAPHA